MIKKNFALEKLNNDETVLGTFVVNPSVVGADIIASSGLDFIIIDREHGPITFETAQSMAIACESRGVSPIMRVGNIDLSSIQNALDTGMHGIQIPNIDTKQNAMDVIQFAKYPPEGLRGFSPFTRAGDYSIHNAQILTQKSNDNTLVIYNIEGINAVNNFDEIMSVEGADVYFVGLFDLSKSLGIPGDTENPLVIRKLEAIVEKAAKQKKKVGTIATNKDQMRQFISMGIKYITYSVDCEILRSSYQSIVNSFDEEIER